MQLTPNTDAISDGRWVNWRFGEKTLNRKDDVMHFNYTMKTNNFLALWPVSLQLSLFSSVSANKRSFQLLSKLLISVIHVCKIHDILFQLSSLILKEIFMIYENLGIKV